MRRLRLLIGLLVLALAGAIPTQDASAQHDGDEWVFVGAPLTEHSVFAAQSPQLGQTPQDVPTGKRYRVPGEQALRLASGHVGFEANGHCKDAAGNDAIHYHGQLDRDNNSMLSDAGDQDPVPGGCGWGIVRFVRITMTVKITPSPTTPAAGGPISYKIEVTNTTQDGDGTAHQLQLNFSAASTSGHVVRTTVDAGGGTCANDIAEQLSCARDSLARQQIWVITVTGRLASDTSFNPGVVTASARLTIPRYPPFDAPTVQTTPGPSSSASPTPTSCPKTGRDCVESTVNFSSDSPCGTVVAAPIIGGVQVPVSATSALAGPVTLSAQTLPTFGTFSPQPGDPARGMVSLAPGLFDWLLGLFAPPPSAVIVASAQSEPPATAACTIGVRTTIVGSF
jgi:hypothetical protein